LDGSVPEPGTFSLIGLALAAVATRRLRRRQLTMKPIRLALLTLAASTLPAAPVQWTIASGGNDHYYDKVGGSFNLFTAEADLTANHATFLGMTGYLVTITSLDEQTFVHALSPATEWWTGGTDVGSPGNWYWAGGPEAGQAFTFDNWGGPPPTGANSYLGIGSCGGPCWLADTGGRQHGYVVEYSAAAVSGAPEPGTLSLLALALAAVASRRLRR
jgi:PEP-CTERM motif